MMDDYGSFSGASLPIIYKHAGKPTLTGGHAVADLLRAVKWHTRAAQTNVLLTPQSYGSLHHTLLFHFLFNKACWHYAVLRGRNMGRAGQNTRAPIRTWRLNAPKFLPEWHKYLWTPRRMSLFLKYSNAARALNSHANLGSLPQEVSPFLQSVQEK